MTSTPTVQIAESLARHPLLGLASEPVLERVAAASTLRTYRSNQRVVLAGSEQADVLVILRGALRLHRRNRDAKTEMLVGVVEAPAIFGDADFYSGARRWNVSARSEEQSTLISIPCQVFDELASSGVAVAAALYRDASARHFLAIELMQVFALQKTEHRILRLLHSRATKSDAHAESVVKVSRTELARSLGLHPKTIARHLAALQRAGLIRRERDRASISKEHLFLASPLRGGLGAVWRLAPDPF